MRCTACGSNWTLPNPVLGGNKKIGVGTLTADITAGSTKAGGSCLAMTAGCKQCYAQALEMFRKNVAAAHDRNFEIVKRSPKEYADLAVAEINEFHRKKKRWPSLVRIHGFGDFYNTEHVRAWIRIASTFPAIRFFGTTRMWRVAASRTGTWQGVGEAKPFLAALDQLREMPNVFLGASMDASTRGSSLPAHLGSGLWIVWLKARGWNIWNMLSEFGDAATRERLGVKVKTGSAAMQAKASAEQFVVAKKIGALIGLGCPEQSGKKASCEACGHCARKGIEVSFAFHSGSTKDKDDSTDVDPGKDAMVVMPAEPTTSARPVHATRSNPMGKRTKGSSRECDICKKQSGSTRWRGSSPREGRFVCDNADCLAEFRLWPRGMRCSYGSCAFVGSGAQLRAHTIRVHQGGRLAPLASRSRSKQRSMSMTCSRCKKTPDACGCGEKPNPGHRFREGDIIQLLETDHYSGFKKGSVGLVIAIPGPGSGKFARFDPVGMLVYAEWYGGVQGSVPAKLTKKIGRVEAAVRPIRGAGYGGERSDQLKRLRAKFATWMREALARSQR